MKPLTIEELKSLEGGDWVWLCGKYENFGEYSEYREIDEVRDDCLVFAVSVNRVWFEYSGYGTKWLAYKNKEQAETKGEIVEVVEYNGYAPYLARDNICGQPLLIVPISEERNKELKEQGVEDTDLCVFLE